METADDVWADFKARLNDATGTLVHARIALTVHRAQLVNNIRAHRMNPATPVEVNSGPIPGHRDGISFQTWDQTTMMDALGDSGVAFRQLGHQWVVFVYQMWEDETRPRLAMIQGVPHNDVKNPILGDLRLIRHDVVHKRGHATRENTSRCAVLRWFTIGDDIFIENRMVAEVMESFGLTRPVPEPGRRYVEVPPPRH